MSFFRRPDYQSEATQFINALHKQDATLQARQYQGRARLWEPSINREAQEQFARNKVKQNAYVYQTKA